MSENSKKKLVVFISRGLDDERAVVSWTLANAGLAAGQEVTVFLVSSGVDLARRGASDLMRMNPLDPSLGELIKSFMSGGGKVWACPPCANLRGYTQDHFIEGVVITGAGPVHAQLMEGAATISL